MKAKTNYQKRQEAKTMYLQHHTNRYIAKTQNVTVQTVGRWVADFKKDEKLNNEIVLNLKLKLNEMAQNKASTPTQLNKLTQTISLFSKLL